MKNVFTFFFCLTASIALFSQSNIQQSLSINTTGAAADPSALLDVGATDKGMLVPVTASQLCKKERVHAGQQAKSAASKNYRCIPIKKRP